MAEPRRAELPRTSASHHRPSELLCAYVSDPQAPRPDEVQRLVSELDNRQLELEVHIRALQEAQRQLEAYRDRYVDLYDLAPLGYVTLDDEGYIQEINLAGARLLGAELAELVGYPFTDFVVAPDQAAFLEHIQKCCVQRQDVTSELGLIAKDGRLVPVQFHSVPVEALEHEGAFCKAAITDITVRKRAEQAIRLNEARLEQLVKERTEALQHAHDELRAVYDGMADGLLIADVETMRLVSANATICRMLGYSEDELLSLGQGHPPGKRLACRPEDFSGSGRRADRCQ